MKLEALKGTGPITLTKKWPVDGTQVDAGAVTYGIVDADGSVVVAAGTAATKNGSGATTNYTVILTVANLAAVGELAVTWTRTDTGASLPPDTVSIVGSVLFAEDEARTFKTVGGITVLSDASDYPDQTIAEGRYLVTEFLERRASVSFVRRYGRVELEGDGSKIASLRQAMRTHGGPGFRRRPLALVHASVGGTALTAAEISKVHADRLRGRFTRYDGNVWNAGDTDQPPLNVVLGYEYGHEEVPWEISDAALRLLVRSVVPSDVSSRAASLSNEDGSLRFLFPGVFSPTGIPVIDKIIGAYDEAAIRLTRDVSVGGRYTLDLSLRRGSRFVEGFLTRHAAATLKVVQNTAEASSNHTAAGATSPVAVVKTGNDADGNRAVVGSAKSFTSDLTNCGLSKASTTVLDFYIGSRIDGSGSQAGDGTGELSLQYLAVLAAETVALRR